MYFPSLLSFLLPQPAFVRSCLPGLVASPSLPAMSSRSPLPTEPSLPWRVTSTATLGAVAAICRVAMFGGNTTKVHGLDRFLGLLDSRKDVEKRERGLITVSNHISVYVLLGNGNGNLDCKV